MKRITFAVFVTASRTLTPPYPARRELRIPTLRVGMRPKLEYAEVRIRPL